jgi:hypothetical protein
MTITEHTPGTKGEDPLQQFEVSQDQADGVNGAMKKSADH